MKNITINNKPARVIDLRPERDAIQINVYFSPGHSASKIIYLHGDQRLIDEIVGGLDFADDNWPPEYAEVATPNITGLIGVLKIEMGGIVALNALMREYPAFYPALLAGEWSDIKDLMLDASASNRLNKKQYDAFKAAFNQHNIPVVLP